MPVRARLPSCHWKTASISVLRLVRPISLCESIISICRPTRNINSYPFQDPRRLNAFEVTNPWTRILTASDRRGFSATFSSYLRTYFRLISFTVGSSCMLQNNGRCAYAAGHCCQRANSWYSGSLRSLPLPPVHMSRTSVPVDATLY